MSRDTIKEHEGRKYLKRIYAAVQDGSGELKFVEVDTYAVMDAFVVTCPGLQHCLKKILMPGQRDKGSKMADLIGARAALDRAIDLENIRIAVRQHQPTVIKASNPEEAKRILAEMGVVTPEALQATLAKLKEESAKLAAADKKGRKSPPVPEEEEAGDPTQAVKGKAEVHLGACGNIQTISRPAVVQEEAAEPDPDFRPEPPEGFTRRWTGEGAQASKRIVPEGAMVWNTHDWIPSAQIGWAPVRSIWYALPEGASFFGDSVDRSHEECFDCARQEVEPPECPGHAQGPSPCKWMFPVGQPQASAEPVAKPKALKADDEELDASPPPLLKKALEPVSTNPSPLPLDPVVEEDIIALESLLIKDRFKLVTEIISKEWHLPAGEHLYKRGVLKGQEVTVWPRAWRGSKVQSVQLSRHTKVIKVEETD